MTVSPEVDTLARTLYGESRNQGERGMEAVACVVMNRVKQPCWWGRSVITVCLKPYQFSCWLSSDPNYRLLKAVNNHDMAFRMALDIAQEAVGGQLTDITGNATHYFERHMKIPPAWVKKLTFTCRIGDHLFYR